MDNLILKELTQLKGYFNEQTLLKNEVLTILYELREFKRVSIEQNLLKKDVLNFSEACQYIDVSESHMYKLTSQKKIPHFCPQGKRLYFNRQELDLWLQQNRQTSADEIETAAANYVTFNKRRS